MLNNNIRAKEQSSGNIRRGLKVVNGNFDFYLEVCATKVVCFVQITKKTATAATLHLLRLMTFRGNSNPAADDFAAQTRTEHCLEINLCTSVIGICAIVHLIKFKMELVFVPAGFGGTIAGSMFPLLLSQESQSPQLCLSLQSVTSPEAFFYLLLHVLV